MNDAVREDLLALVTTKTSWNRRDFVVSSLATGFAAAAAPVCAQTMIKTDTTGLTAGEVRIKTKDVEIPAYRAKPASGRGFPVVLVVQEIFGVHEHIKDVCRRLAKIGYLAVAPEMYARQGDVSKIAEIKEIFAQVVSKVPDSQVMSDLDAAVAWARGDGGDASRLAVTGFCWGGRITWLYAAHNQNVKAGVAWYGRVTGPKNDMNPAHPIDVVDRINAPVLGLYGAADAGIPNDTVEQMNAALKKAGKRSNIILYENAPHAFHADYRPSYRKEIADDGFARLRAWFAQNL